MNNQTQKPVEIVPPPMIEIALPPNKLLKDKNGNYTVLSDYHKNRLRQGWRYQRTKPWNRIDLFSDACEEFLNRRNGQLGSKKPRAKKTKINESQDLKSSPRKRKPRVVTLPPSKLATVPAINDYLAFLNNQPQNRFTVRVNHAVRVVQSQIADFEITTANLKHELSNTIMESKRTEIESKIVKIQLKNDKRIEWLELLEKLPNKPSYRLHQTNRLFADSSWQTVPRPLRKILFAGTNSHDFRSLHFTIFLALLKRESPKHYSTIVTTLGEEHIWDFFKRKKIRVQNGKNCVLRIINGGSKREALKTLYKNLTPTEIKLMGKDVELRILISTIYEGCKLFKSIIRDHGLSDAYGNTIQQETWQEFNNRTFYSKKTHDYRARWKRTLNTVYNSFELRLVVESIGDLIHEKEFSMLLHLHDGFFWSTNNKYVKNHTKQMKMRATNIMATLDIVSELADK
jgi:hypothetical protein